MGRRPAIWEGGGHCRSVIESGCPMHVLCVDDEPMNRRVVRELLEAAGLTVEEAPDAKAALDLIETCSFDLVLMDLRMPGMDGLSAVRSIRARKDERSSVPVIMVTADESADLDERSAAAGAEAVVRKPIDMRILFDAIASVVYPTGSATLT